MMILAESAVLVSLFKPLLLAVIVIAWAKVVGRLDKDMDYFFLKRKLWNMILLLSGVAGIALALLVNFFFIGILICLVMMVGTVAAYWSYRNKEVPEKERWAFGLGGLREKVDQRKSDSAQKSALLKLVEMNGTEIEVPYGDNPDTAAHERIQDIFSFALPRGAEYVDIVVDSTQGKLNATIDGAKHALEPLNSSEGSLVLDYLKRQSGMNLIEKRKKQTAQLKVISEELGTHILDLTTSGSTSGATLRIEFDKNERLTLEFESLGLLESQKQQLTKLLEGQQKGVILVAVPSKQGLSTTLSSLIGKHDPYTQQIITLEDEIPVKLEGVDHSLVKANTPIEQISEDMARMLRSDPGVIMLSKLYDPKLAVQLAKSAEFMRAYIGMRQEDTFSTLKAWCKAVGKLEIAGDTIGAVISERLIRKLCSTCRVPMKPNSSALKKLNLSPDKVIYKQSGKVMIKDQEKLCPDCHGVGYRGRTGVFEIMVLDDDARKLIKAGDFEQLRKHLRRQKMLWMQEAALALVVEGKTSIAEISRVMESAKKSKAKS